MSEQKTRIPDIDPSQFGPQSVRATDEGDIVLSADPREFTTKWVGSYIRRQRLESMEAPQIILGREEKLLEKERLMREGQEVLSNLRSRTAFDKLVTDYAGMTGKLDELVANTGAILVGETPEERLLRLMKVAGAYTDLKPSDSYGFADVFLDKKTPQTVRKQLVALHAEALGYAQATLNEREPSLRETFVASLKIAVSDGILPANALPDPNNAPARANRVHAVEVFASDPVVNRLVDRGGHYKAKENAIHIDADTVIKNGEALRQVYTHEMLHAYSGLTVRLDNSDDLDDEEYWEEVHGGETDVEKIYRRGDPSDILVSDYVKVSRVGLRRSLPTLNEAYTEWATMQLTDRVYDQQKLWDEFCDKFLEDGQINKDKQRELHDFYNDQFFAPYGHIYLAERIMLAGLVAHGIDTLKIGEAYFESYEPKKNDLEREIGQTVPARRALDAAIAEHTPYKSLEQLQRKLYAEARTRYPDVKRDELVWCQAAILAEVLDQQR